MSNLDTGTQGRSLRLALAVAGLCLLTAVPGIAGDRDLATVRASSSGIEWQALAPRMGLTLSVSGPLGFYLREEFAPGQAAVFSVFDKAGALRPAGSYVYELRPAPRIDQATREELEVARKNGDEGGARLRAGRLALDAQSGAFAIADGAIVMGGQEELGAGEPVGSGGSRIAPKDQVIPDDLIVQGSACVGLDCVNNENFGFDTIRLKENNLRIHFDDTSTTAGFPANDWRLIANDSASGGQSKFSIEDSTGARTPFTVEAGATTNSVYVDSTGRVGFRTSTPVLDLHVNTSNTPALRLEQNNSGGFTAQTWDVAGNEANFFIRDVTGGSRLSLRIRPGAPTSSIDANEDGVGIQTASADTELTVQSLATNSDVVKVRRSGSSDSLFRVFEASTGEGVFSIFDAANTENIRLTGQAQGRVSIGCASGLAADLTLNAAGGGACGVGTESTINAGATAFTITSSRGIKENLQTVEAPDILDKIRNIDVYTYDFIEGPEDRIGLMAEDFHQVFQRGSDKLLDGQEVEMAMWLAIQQLIEENRELRGEIEQLKQR